MQVREASPPATTPNNGQTGRPFVSDTFDVSYPVDMDVGGAVMKVGVSFARKTVLGPWFTDHGIAPSWIRRWSQ